MTKPSTHVIEIESGSGDPPFIALTHGEEMKPISVGKQGMWRLETTSPVDLQAFVYFDGTSLFVRAADDRAAPLLNGNRVGRDWSRVDAPSAIDLGTTRLRFRKGAPGAPRPKLPAVDAAPTAAYAGGAPVRAPLPDYDDDVRTEAINFTPPEQGGYRAPRPAAGVAADAPMTFPKSDRSLVTADGGNDESVETRVAHVDPESMRVIAEARAAPRPAAGRPTERRESEQLRAPLARARAPGNIRPLSAPLPNPRTPPPGDLPPPSAPPQARAPHPPPPASMPPPAREPADASGPIAMHGPVSGPMPPSLAGPMSGPIPSSVTPHLMGNPLAAQLQAQQEQIAAQQLAMQQMAAQAQQQQLAAQQAQQQLVIQQQQMAAALQAQQMAAQQMAAQQMAAQQMAAGGGVDYPLTPSMMGAVTPSMMGATPSMMGAVTPSMMGATPSMMGVMSPAIAYAAAPPEMNELAAPIPRGHALTGPVMPQPTPRSHAMTGPVMPIPRGHAMTGPFMPQATPRSHAMTGPVMPHARMGAMTGPVMPHARMGAMTGPVMPHARMGAMTGPVMPPGRSMIGMAPSYPPTPPPPPVGSLAYYIERYKALPIFSKTIVTLAPLLLLASGYLFFFDKAPAQTRAYPGADAGPPTLTAPPTTTTPQPPSPIVTAPAQQACPAGFVPYPVAVAPGQPLPCVPAGTPMPANTQAPPAVVLTAPTPPAPAPPTPPVAAPGQPEAVAAAPAPPTLERQAVDAVAQNDYPKAAALYEQLLTQNPSNRVYAEAARILRAKAVTPPRP